MTYPPPQFPDASARVRVRKVLDDAAFREPVIRDRLKAGDAASVRELGRPILDERIDGLEGPLRELLRLFLLCRPTDVADLEAFVGREAIRYFIDSGMVDVQANTLRATVQLSTVEDLVIAADLPERHLAHAADFVLGPFGVTLKLASLVMRRTARSVLDLGCGSGTLGALAAAHAESVVATDINPRAVAFARFNAELNGLDHLECREGSFFEPVEGERFDLILCNPPYVISPGETYVYRDGGTGVCRRIVSEAPAYLADGGHLQMMLEWPEPAGEEWRSLVTGWLDEVGCDAWLLRFYTVDAAQYADLWLRQEYPGQAPPSEEMKRWMTYLGSQGAESVGGGMLVLRPARGGTPVRALRDAPPQSAGLLGESVFNWISAQSVLGSLDDDPAVLLDTRLLPAPHLERTERRTPSGEGWTTRSREVRLSQGLRFAAKIDPVAEEIVGLLDGVRTPRQALELFADRHGLDVEPFLAGLPKALAKLLELGLLVPGARADEIP